MRPKLSLAGLNRLRGVIAIMSGLIAVGHSYASRFFESGAELTDSALLSVLWIYVGVTAVPWASIKGLAGSGAVTALTVGAWAAYLGAAMAATTWSVVEHPAFREAPVVASPPRCVSEPAAPVAADAGAPVRRAAPPVVATPDAGATPHTATADVATAQDAMTDASAGAAADAAVVPASDADASEREGRRRRRRHRDDDEDDTPITAVIERDPVPPPQ